LIKSSTLVDKIVNLQLIKKSTSVDKIINFYFLQALILLVLRGS